MAVTMTPAFGLQQPEDSMEISSEYGVDADIDIDLDGAPDNMLFMQDDHQMIEDPKSDRPDDVMVDDPINLEDNDRVMQDDAPPQEQDEELLDFSDGEDDIQIDLQDQPLPQSLPQPSITVDEPIELVQSELATELLTEGVEPVNNASPQRHQDIQSQPQPEITEPTTQQHFSPPVAEATFYSTDTVEHDSEEQLPHPEPQVISTIESDVQPQSTESPSQEPHHDSITENTEVAQPEHDETAQQNYIESGELQSHDQQGNNEINHLAALENKSTSQPALPRLDTTEVPAHDETEDVSRERQGNSPTVTGLHPTVVEYDGNEVYLFPSKDPVVSEQYLLDNENLVTTSLGDLLQACRTALGDGITEDEELVLGVEELDLYVSEDSTPAFSTSFQELLDIYLQLHRLDGNDTPPPFRVSLSTKTRFTNRLTLITQAISEGKGFSQLSFLQYYQYDEPTELPDEDFDDDFDESAEIYPGHVSDHAEQQDQKTTEAQEAAVEPVQKQAHDQLAQKNETTHTEQANPQDPAESHEGEYEGGVNAQTEQSTEAVDQSEVNQEETQYFDAEGDEVLEATEPQEQDQSDSHREGEPDAAQGEATGADDDDDDSYLNYDHNEDPQDIPADQSGHESVLSEQTLNEVHASGHGEEFEEQLEHDDQNGADEEQEFGLGEFFDENSYEYTENDQNADEPKEESYTGEDYNEGEDLYQNETAQLSADGDKHEQIVEAPGNEEADPGNSIDQVPAASGAHDQIEASHQEDGTEADASTAQDGVTTEDASAYLENGEEQHAAPDATLAGDDFDEINFDDEDGYEDELQQSGFAPEATNGSSKTSPTGKRSFSERDEFDDGDDDDDDEQDNKKARAA